MKSLPSLQTYLAEGLVKHVSVKDSSSEESCPICHDDYIINESTSETEDEIVNIKPCDHVFHRSCITLWFTQGSGRNTCPMCRQTLFTHGSQYPNSPSRLVIFRTYHLATYPFSSSPFSGRPRLYGPTNFPASSERDILYVEISTIHCALLDHMRRYTTRMNDPAYHRVPDWVGIVAWCVNYFREQGMPRSPYMRAEPEFLTFLFGCFLIQIACKLSIYAHLPAEEIPRLGELGPLVNDAIKEFRRKKKGWRNSEGSALREARWNDWEFVCEFAYNHDDVRAVLSERGLRERIRDRWRAIAQVRRLGMGGPEKGMLPF